MTPLQPALQRTTLPGVRPANFRRGRVKAGRMSTWRALALTLLMFVAWPAVAADAAWPTRPLRMLVPLAAGSTADIISRLVGVELSKALGQPVVVENKAGAGGTIASAELARAAPDGYTIGFASQGTLVFNQALYAKPGYDSVKDFTPLTFAGGVSNVMVVASNSLWRDPAGVVESARTRPGQLSFSSGGSGTSHHLSGVLFGQLTSTDLLHVPYKGAPQGILAVMSGEVSMGFFNTPTVISQVREGRLKALAVTSLKRSPLLPDVPTLDEKGIRGYEVNTWFGWIAPANLPPALTQRLSHELGLILARPDIREMLLKQGFEVASPGTPDAFARFIASDLAKWVPLVRKSGAKVD